MLTMQSFIQQFTLREGFAISSAKVLDVTKIYLPKNSLLHFVPDTRGSLGIRGSHPFIATLNDETAARIYFPSEDSLLGDSGRFRKQAFNSHTFLRNFRTSQKRFMVNIDPSRPLRRVEDMAIYDYSCLLMKRSYPTRYDRYYNEWLNIQTAVMTMVDKDFNDRENFLVVKLPTQIPTMGEFEKLEKKGWDQTLLTKYTENGHFWLKEIYNCLSVDYNEKDHSKTPIQSILQGPKQDKTWVVLVDGINAVIINVGDFVKRSSADSIKFLNLVDTFIDMRQGYADAEETEEVTGAEKEVITNDDSIDSDDDEEEDFEYVTDKSETEVSNSEARRLKREADAKMELQKKEVFSGEEQIVPNVPNSVVRRLTEINESGRISNAQVQRYISIAENFHTLDNPFGKGTIEEAMVLKPEQIKLDKKIITAAEKNPAIDKTLLYSSVDALKRDYMNKGGFQAHLNMAVAHLNNFGYLVRDVRVEPYQDAVNNYMVLKIKVLSIESGKEQTIPIEIPVPSEDGTFKADGVSYIMDDQKVDKNFVFKKDKYGRKNKISNL